jgi:tetratricopeptide (TPR) repeat protein
MRPFAKLLLLALILATAPASAQEAEMSEARRRFVLGTGYYDAGRYAEAAREFEAAYLLSGRAALLFNIARAEQRAGEDARAIAWLKRYLAEVPDAADGSSVRSQIEALEQTLARRAAPVQVAAPPPPPAAVPPPPPPLAPADPRPARMKAAGWALLGTGAAVTVTGIVLGAVSAQAGTQVSTASGEFSGRFSDTESRGQLTQALGIGFDVIGGVALATGAGLLIAARVRR